MADPTSTTKGLDEGTDYQTQWFEHVDLDAPIQGVMGVRRDGVIAHGGLICPSVATSNASLTTGAGTPYSSGDVIGVPLEIAGCGLSGELHGMVLRDTNGDVPDNDNIRVLLFSQNPSSTAANNAALGDPIPNLSYLQGGGTVNMASGGFGWCNQTGTFGQGYATSAGSLWAVFVYASSTTFTFTATTGGLTLALRVKPS